MLFDVQFQLTTWTRERSVRIFAEKLGNIMSSWNLCFLIDDHTFSISFICQKAAFQYGFISVDRLKHSIALSIWPFSLYSQPRRLKHVSLWLMFCEFSSRFMLAMSDEALWTYFFRCGSNTIENVTETEHLQTPIHWTTHRESYIFLWELFADT